MIPMALQTVKACEDTSAAGALETGMMLAGRAVSGPGRPGSQWPLPAPVRRVSVSAAECANVVGLQGTAGPVDIV